MFTKTKNPCNGTTIGIYSNLSNLIRIIYFVVNFETNDVEWNRYYLLNLKINSILFRLFLSPDWHRQGIFFEILLDSTSKCFQINYSSLICKSSMYYVTPILTSTRYILRFRHLSLKIRHNYVHTDSVQQHIDASVNIFIKPADYL